MEILLETKNLTIEYKNIKTDSLNKLKEKGIDDNIIEKIIAEQEVNPLEAAMKLAKKRRIGPYSQNQNLRKERRSKDLAILVRAGFDYDVAVNVLDMPED